MKMKSICLLAMVSILFSCVSSNDMDSKSQEGNYFFDFDELVHYKMQIDEHTLIQKADDENLSADEQLQIDLIVGDTPESIGDTIFVGQLENIGFEKRQIHKDKFERISSIFKEKEVDNAMAYSCIAVYRDILIFKKNSKIIGMAKICFSCNQKRIYGTEAKTINFGQDGDYGKLSKILNE